MFFHHNSPHGQGRTLNWTNMDAKKKRLREIMCELQGGGAKEGDKKQKRRAKKRWCNH